MSMGLMVHALTVFLVAPENVQMEIAREGVVEVIGVGDHCKSWSRMLR